MIARILALALLALLALTLMPAPSSAQSSTQLINGATMASLIAGGTFVNAGSCSFSGDLVVSRSTFVSCIKNNGSCAGSSQSMITYGAMLACRVLYTLETWNVNCTADSGGDEAYCSAVDYSLPNVTISNGPYPVAYSLTVGTNCSEAITIGPDDDNYVGGTDTFINGNGAGGALSGNYGGGATGILTVSAQDVRGGSGCTLTGTVTYYH